MTETQANEAASTETTASTQPDTGATQPTNSRLEMFDNKEAPPEEKKDPDTPVEKKETSFNIPAEYKEKGWAKNIKTESDLWKTLDNAQALIGKKTIIPNLDEATPQQIEEYYAAMRPKEKTAYQFAENISDNDKAEIADILYKNGISLKQGNDVIKDYLEFQGKQITKAFDVDDFTNGLKQIYGDNFESQAKSAAAVISKNLSEADRALVEQMPNPYVHMLYRLASSIEKGYGIKESGAAATPAASVKVDIEAQRNELRKQIQEANKSPLTLNRKNELVNKLLATYPKGNQNVKTK